MPRSGAGKMIWAPLLRDRARMISHPLYVPEYEIERADGVVP